MKELTLFTMRGCPHCRMAREYMRELCQEDPRYARGPVNEIDENENAALADSYDYYYVPCYFMGDKKLHEGACTKEKIRKVLDTALNA